MAFNAPQSRALEEQLGNTIFPATNLGDLCVFMAGGATPRRQDESQYAESGIKFLRIQNVTEHGLDFDDVKFIGQTTHDELLNRSQLQNGDVLMTITGRIGTAATVREADLPANINQHIVLLRVDQSQIAPDFLTVFLNSDLGAQLSNRSVTGTTRLALDYGAVRAIPIPLPPLAIQARLVADLESARLKRSDDLARADALLAGVDAWLLDQLGLMPPAPDARSSFAVTLNQARQRFDVDFHHPEFHQLKELIHSGSHSRLGDLVKFSSETWQPEQAQGETFHYIEISGIDLANGTAHAQETLVAEAPSRARMLVREGDLIISTTRPHHGAIAPIGAELNESVASTGFAVIRDIEPERLNRDYLWCILRSQLCLRQMLYRSSGGNYPAIVQSELEQVLIPLPPLALQQAIAAEVKQRRDQARVLRDEAEAAWTKAKARFEAQLLGGE